MKLYFKPPLWLTVFTASALIILLSLGTWQIYRLDWKNDLINEYNHSFNKEPINLSEISNNSNFFNYRRIKVSGKLNHKNEIHVIGKTYEGNAGFHIITPLTTEDGSTILVNRGWVPKKYIKRETRLFSLPKGIVEVVGLVRMPQIKGKFVPVNEPENGFWFTIIPSQILEFIKVKGEKTFYIDELKVGNDIVLPIPIDGKIKIPNNHLQYAMTWYSLAIGLAVIYFLWNRSKGYLKIKK